MPPTLLTRRRIIPTAAPLVPPICVFQKQARPKWCWAACVSMVLESRNQPRSQCQIAGSHLGKSCCSLLLPAQGCIGLGLSECDETIHEDDIEALWHSNGVPAQTVNSALTVAQLDQIIVTNRRPVMIFVDGGGNTRFDHVMLIVGKDDATMYKLADPCMNRHSLANHEELVAFRDGWKRSWINL